MKYTTLENIVTLKNIMLAKQDEINHLTAQLESLHNLIPVMSEKAKGEAYAEALAIKDRIAELRKYVSSAKAEINAFYAPAQKVA